MIKCVVFDFDGTLVKSNEIKRRVFYEVTEDIVDAVPVLDELFSVPDSGDRYNIFDLLIKNLKLVCPAYIQKYVSIEFLKLQRFVELLMHSQN